MLIVYSPMFFGLIEEFERHQQQNNIVANGPLQPHGKIRDYQVI